MIIPRAANTISQPLGAPALAACCCTKAEVAFMSSTTSPLNSARFAWAAHGPRSLPALSTDSAEKSAAVTVAELTAEVAVFTAEDPYGGIGRESELPALALNIASIQIDRDW
jgi:hypothetical protein